MIRILKKSVFLFLFIWVGIGTIFAETRQTLQIGDTLPDLSYESQFGEKISPPADTRFVLFSRDKKSGRMGRDALDSLGGKDFMDQKKAIYISDISGAPSLIRSLFVIPSLKKTSFFVYLILEEKLSDPFPSSEDSVTILELDKGKIKKISYAKDMNEISALLVP